MSAAPTLRASALCAATVAVALLAGCGGDSSQSALPPAVDLLRQAAPASEIVDAALLARHTQGVLEAREPARYLAQELARIGLVPGGAKGGWVQPFEDRRRVVRPTGTWVLARGEGRATLGTRDLVAALGTRVRGARLRGFPAVFVAPTLAAPAGALASKVIVVLDPVASTQPGAPPPLPDLLRRAAAARAHAVLVLPRPGVTTTLPTPARAAELAADTGVGLVAWLNETAARAFVKIGLDVPLETMARLEWRSDLLPLALGTLTAEAMADVEREPHRNVIALLPPRGGGEDEALAVVATLPRRRGAAAASEDRRSAAAAAANGDPRTEATARPANGDRRAEAAAAAELLAVATAFQALSDPPQHAVVFAFTDPGDDGLAGARQLVADARWKPPRLDAAVVIAAGNLGPPTQDVRFVGARASPLYGMTARLAALQCRRVVGDVAPARGLLWKSPAWAFIQAQVPAVLLEPGVVPRPGPGAPGVGGFVAAAAEAPQPFSGLVEDSRLAFRVALELAEGGRPPRVDPARVEAVLRQPEPAPVVVPTPRARRVASTVSATGSASTGAPVSSTGEDATAGAGAATGAPNTPEVAAPPPSGEPPSRPAEGEPAAPRQRDEGPREPAPSPSPPQRR